MKTSIIIVVFDICIFFAIFGADRSAKFDGFISFTLFSIVTSTVMWTKLFTSDIKDESNNKVTIAILIILALVNSCFPFVAFALAREIASI